MKNQWCSPHRYYRTSPFRKIKRNFKKESEMTLFQGKNLAEKNTVFVSKNWPLFLGETAHKTKDCFTNSSEEEKEEKEYARMIRDKDKAMAIHQKMGHMCSQKIIESIKTRTSIPEYDRIPWSVIYHLKNIKCDKCALTDNNQIRHPISKTKQRAKCFEQNIQCDVLYGPNRFKAMDEVKFYDKVTFDQSHIPWRKSEIPKTETDYYISRVGFDAQSAIVFVDEFSRWTTVVPLRNLKEDDFISAFIVFQSELVKMMHKYKNNQRLICNIYRLL
jgi:hypothetical protein